MEGFRLELRVTVLLLDAGCLLHESVAGVFGVSFWSLESCLL